MDTITAARLAIEIFNHVADGEDGTASTSGADLPGEGYFVGGVGDALVFDGFGEANASTALRKVAEFLGAQSAAYIGWWADSASGKIYVDGTSWHADYDDAEQACRERGEIAFWDIANKREFRPTVLTDKEV